MPDADDNQVIHRQLGIKVFFTVLALIAIVLAVALIPDAQRPTIRQAPRTTTTTTILPAPNGP